MTEIKLLNKHLVNGFLTVTEPLARLLVSLEVHPHVVTFAGLVFSLLALLAQLLLKLLIVDWHAHPACRTFVL